MGRQPRHASPWCVQFRPMRSDVLWIVFAGLGILAGQIGCASKPKDQTPPPPNPAIAERPIIDFARGGAGMPIDGEQPLTSVQALSDGLLHAIQSRVIFTDAAPAV